VIRTIALTALAVGALATPALAFETQMAAAPSSNTPHFVNGAKILSMMPAVASEPFRFGPSDQAQTKGATVVYDISSGKASDRVDVTDPRDNPFLPQVERSPRRSPQGAPESAH
jgi:hypothetical protein